MQIHDAPQGTSEWLAARAGIPTASELKRILTDAGAPRKGDMPEIYLAFKLAERWRGSPLQTFGGGAMEQGSLLEPDAIAWYEMEFACDVERPGFITTDDGQFGCSPDGLILPDMGLEIKCPQPPAHVSWLLAGGCPEEHVLQCQGGMFVTGYPAWRFVSYCRGFPALVVTVERDEKYQRAIGETVAAFTAKLDAGYARLLAANGGLEPIRAQRDPSELQHAF